MYNSRFFTIAFMIFIAALSRLIPHPPNFSPIFAISLFAGTTILSRKESIFIPLVAMLISDYFIGFHALMPVVYVLTLLMVCAGWSVQRKSSTFRIAGFSVLGSLVFFLVTNFAVWISSGMYSLNLAGFWQCYSAAIPFFQNTLLGDVFYSGLLFGSLAVLEKLKFIEPELNRTTS